MPFKATILPMAENDSTSLGILGRYYSARHTLGQYRSVCVTATYNIDWRDEASLASDHQRLERSLERALQSTIQQHPGLLIGISDKEKDGIPLFQQIYTINREDILKTVSSQDYQSTNDLKAGGIFDQFLSQVLGQEHAEFFSARKPAWKVVMVKHMGSFNFPDPQQNPLLRLDIAFFAHHAIADGLSGVVFHASLLDNLKRAIETGQPAHWPLQLQRQRDLPVTVEDRVDCLSCSCDLCNGPNSFKQPVWGGAAISTTPITNFESCVRIVTVPSEELSAILQQCRQAKATLTGLLHSFICTALARGLDGNESGFRSVTPFSIRQHTGASKTDIVNHVCFLTSYVSNEQLSAIKNCDKHSTAERQHIMNLARSFSNEIATKVKQYPHGNMVKKVGRIKNTMSHCQSQAGTKRMYTYELSNMGSISLLSPPMDRGISLDKMLFTQCGLVSGPALAFNCVSVAGGSLTIGITWEKGIVEESLVGFITQDLEIRLLGKKL